MRLQKYIASCGVASRRAAEAMIADGQVEVNGSTVREMGTQVGPGDEVTVWGRKIEPEARKRTLAYCKPIGEVTTASDPQGRPTVLDRFRDFPERLYPVGRLDFDSEGLLLLTNDGELTQRLTHPRHEVEKTYVARLSGKVGEEELRLLRSGILLDGRLTAPAEVTVLRCDAFSTELSFIIREGRNRQIRRMAEAVGHEVVALRRVAYGPVTLGTLKRGEWRELTPEESALLNQ